MPLGTQQNNDFAQVTIDVWNDKVFYQEQEFPAGFMAASILNISEDDFKELIQSGGAPTFLFPVVIQGSDMEAAQVLPVLRERMIYLAREIWKYPPFCYSNLEKELRRIDILFDDNALPKIRTPNSELQQDFLIFCAAITRIPMAILHFIAAGRFFELDYLRRLKKRNETYFAVAAHDCFNSKEFWDELRELQNWDVEQFSVHPDRIPVELYQILVLMTPRIRSPVIRIGESTKSCLITIINCRRTDPGHLHNNRFS